MIIVLMRTTMLLLIWITTIQPSFLSERRICCLVFAMPLRSNNGPGQSNIIRECVSTASRTFAATWDRWSYVHHKTTTAAAATPLRQTQHLPRNPMINCHRPNTISSSPPTAYTPPYVRASRDIAPPTPPAPESNPPPPTHENQTRKHWNTNGNTPRDNWRRHRWRIVSTLSFGGMRPSWRAAVLWRRRMRMSWGAFRRGARNVA
mmetsp:Transcript_29133/g.49646  ORF Transcript_29133/g.49646 Transcript_29133/m.49646 type:complete len:205 (-) Transcript_29133:1037-1651(-)